MTESIDDRIVTLYNFGLLTYNYPEYVPVYELMVTGYAIQMNLPRSFVMDSLYYMYKNKGEIE